MNKATLILAAFAVLTGVAALVLAIIGATGLTP